MKRGDELSSIDLLASLQVKIPEWTLKDLKLAINQPLTPFAGDAVPRAGGLLGVQQRDRLLPGHVADRRPPPHVPQRRGGRLLGTQSAHGHEQICHAR